MTLSLTVYEPSTGAFGSVICSSSPAVASRCQHLRAGIGAVATQMVTNPALGGAALDAIASGESAASALAAALVTDRHSAYRQLVVVDRHGSPAVHTGAKSLGIHAESLGKHEAAAGNMLARAKVIDALRIGYLDSNADTLEERLLAGLAAGLEAGGEAGPVHSAGLAVVEDVPWAVTDLRVDWHENPLEELRALWELWRPQKQDYRTRGLDPRDAPSYGVPGDL
jgi:uncharacterized Ntn-hydrolase superfamily protein